MASESFSEVRNGLLETLEDKIDLESAKEALLDIEKHGTVSWEDVKRELGL